MDGRFLIWSCSIRKFMKIVSSEREYKERIGCKLNSIWYIKIRITKEYCNSDRFSTYPVDNTYYTMWDVQIQREHGLDKVCKINAKLVLNAKVLEDVEMHFGLNEDTYSFNLNRGTKVTGYNLYCVLRFPDSVSTPNVIEEHTLVSKLKYLADDFQAMFDKGHLTDITLKCGDDVFQAHKFVLSARSPVFEAMFASPMQESADATVIVKDIDSGLFRNAISFLYSGQVKISSVRMASDFLYVSEKYQIKELKEGCVEYLLSVLSGENAVKILEVLDLYNSDLKSKAKVLNFFKENFDELKNTPEWEELKSKNAALALAVHSLND